MRKLRKIKENRITYKPSFLAAPGLQDLPLLSILGNILPGFEGFSTMGAKVRREL